MIILRKIGPNLAIFIGDNIIVHNLENVQQKIIKIPEPPVQPNLTKSLQEILKPENRIITSVCVSKSAEFIVVTLQNRQLIILNADLSVLKNIMTNRAVSKTTFTNHNDVLLADKTGDVYLCKINSVEEPELILGHLSMLLDVALSDCGKYIVTCDRDEKIRVSCYPNAYNIASYCLGHKEFVNSLVISGTTLLSASGDGTVRSWNFLAGKETACINTNDYIKDKSGVEKFCKEMDDEKVDISAAPIIDMQVFGNFVAVTVLGFNGLQLYKMDGEFLGNLEVSGEIISFSFSEQVFILTTEGLLVYKLTANGCEKINSDKINQFYEHYKEMLLHNKCTISALYKRKYDNVQDYLEKKRLRLENKS